MKGDRNRKRDTMLGQIRREGGNEKEGKKVGLCQTEQTVRISHIAH